MYYRIEELKNMFNASPSLTICDKNNIKAILEAYRSGTLKVQLGYASYWYNGILKRGLATNAIDLDEALPRWRAEHGQGKHWVERVSSCYTLLCLVGGSEKRIHLQDTRNSSDKCVSRSGSRFFSLPQISAWHKSDRTSELARGMFKVVGPYFSFLFQVVV